MTTDPLPPGVSVVVPVFNSESTLPALVGRIAAVFRDLGVAHEVLLVNDGSRDGSWLVVQTLAAADPRVRGLDLMRNFGQHNAVVCGVRAARFDTVVTLDDDLQHPPEEIPKLLAGLAAGSDVVYGSAEAGRHGLWRNLASRATKLALRGAVGWDTARKVSAFRAFRTRLRDAFADYRSALTSCDVLLTWGTTRFAAVAVRHEPRRVGASNYTFRTLVGHALTMLTGFSVLPLRLSSLTGVALTVFGAGVLAFVVCRYLVLGYSVPGFPFLASLVTIFSGAQLLALGIIGEYLARMHDRMMDRPMYVVRREAGAEAAGRKEAA